VSKGTEELIAIAIVAFVAYHYLTTSAATTQAQIAAAGSSSSDGSDLSSLLGTASSFAGDFS
jgi:hypothetical protein